jgi:hypothetical protein
VEPRLERTWQAANQGAQEATAMTASQSPTEYVRQLLERLRPDRRMSLAICLGAAACFGLSYYDALTDMELRDTTLPPNAVRRLPDGRLLLRDGSIIGK